MKARYLTLLPLLLIIPPVNAGELYTITAEQWAVPRSAENLVAMPGLNNAVQAMQASRGSRLLIRFPGGDEGTLWLSELRSWLISLGISSSQIETVPGGEPGRIELEVLRGTPTVKY